MPGADRGPADRQFRKTGQASTRSARCPAATWNAQPLISWLSLTGIASMRCVRPVLTMSWNSCFAFFEGRMEMPAAREAGLRRFEISADVNCSRDHVIRGLAHVHVVVRMDLCCRVGEDLVRARRDHFVRVHVRGRAGAGLENVEGKLLVPFAVRHFERGLMDRVGDAWHRAGPVPHSLRRQRP